MTIHDRLRLWSPRLLVVALLSSATCAPVEPEPTSAARPPNVVVIVTDDQRAGTLHWLPTVRRQLVRRGTKFTRAMVPTSTCCPSRASILTGLFAQDTTVWANGGDLDGTPLGGWEGFSQAGMEDQTIATRLDPTHRTILVGKYLNGYDKAPSGHVPPGWDEWHSFWEHNGKYYDYQLVHTDGSMTHHGNRPAAYSTDVLRRLAVRSIVNTPPDEPLFLFFTPTAPHGPSTPARRHEGLGADLRRFRSPSLNERHIGDKPPWIRSLSRVDLENLHELRQREFESLRAVDEAVGAILRALRRTGRIHDTLILFISDNGGSWGEHRIPPKSKYLPYDAQTRVPLVMRWDGRVRQGASDGRIALNLDIPATIADAVGLTLDGVSGRSLLDRSRRKAFVLGAVKAVAGRGNGSRVSRPAYCGFRTARFLYVRYTSGHEELYNYRRDRYEMQNLARDDRFDDRRAALRARTQKACDPAPPGFHW